MRARQKRLSIERLKRRSRSMLIPTAGQLQFSQYCARCHGSQAQGNANRAIPALAGQRFAYLPSLRNQHYSYLVNQMHKLGEGRRHNVDEDLVRFLRSIDEQDMNATADYLSRLRGPGAVHKVMRNDGVVVD